MDEITTCSVCHVTVRPTDFYCYNCGHALRPSPPSTTLLSLTTLFLGSIILPPMGIVWSVKYLRSQDYKTRSIGLLLILTTVIVLIVVTRFTIDSYNTAIKQMDQIQNIQGF